MTVGARHRLLPGREGAAIRDLDKFARAQVQLAIVKFAATYSEPMTMAFPRAPAGVLLIRLQEDASPETTVAAYAVTSFTYTQQGVRFDAIEGPTVGERYRFTFLVIG